MRCTVKKVDTRDEMLVNILDVIRCIKERQGALRRTKRHVSHELQSALMLIVKFSKVYYKLYQLYQLNNNYRY